MNTVNLKLMGGSGKRTLAAFLRHRQPMYALSITFADHQNNAFVDLGGAAWETRKEQLEQWNSIPAAPGGDKATCFLLDKIGKNGIDIEDTKCITAEQVEFLLSEPIASLIERGRKNCPDCQK